MAGRLTLHFFEVVAVITSVVCGLVLAPLGFLGGKGLTAMHGAGAGTGPDGFVDYFPWIAMVVIPLVAAIGFGVIAVVLGAKRRRLEAQSD